MMYRNNVVKRPISKRPKIGFQDQLLLNAGQKYCRMLPLEHSAILLTFIKLPFVIKIFVLSIFELPFYTSFTVKILNLKLRLFSMASASPIASNEGSVEPVKMCRHAKDFTAGF